jgi:hypothetical protein
LRTVTPTRSLICLHAREGSRRARASIPLHFAQFLSVSCDALRWEQTAGNFAGEKNSLHALVVKRESSEKGFPYLLGTHLLGRAVGVENFHIVSELGPEILKSAIEDVFKRVSFVLIQ